MLPSTNLRKKPKSPGIDFGVNIKTSITCTDVPEGLFDPNTAKRHFSKFGKVQRIRLYLKRQMCLVEYEHIMAAEKAVLNAGAFDGFMFDVTRTKPRVRRKSKKEDDPDWVPDSDVEEELSAMGGVPTYRTTRNKSMEVESEISKPKTTIKLSKKLPIKKKQPVTMRIREPPPTKPQITSGIESPIPVTNTQTSMSLFEAASELHQLRSRISLTPDEQWRTLDARDRILRAWGGAGARVKVGGATIGTCTDMCPEKERLHRQAEHQVMTLETEPSCEGQLEPLRAVKQYSRSSADQEIPMCYELRPASVLMRTCSYLLHEIADTTRQISLADWFHFMWDRFRSIRKDITQQALCCAESIRLVEICARFHAHCAARLADLEHTQFDQKLNTDNLTKCLQTLKHMYSDVSSEEKPQEAEFRGYIALLNLGDSNFWWEIKQLPLDIQKSEPITFAIQIFNALDNNNYVRFFRLIKEKATYLQACILLRYFNDVRARALARIVKAYAPRGGSRFPADDLMNALAFESLDSMKSFISHYGLRFTRTDDTDISVILDRNQFIEDSDPYPLARSIQLIESKRTTKVCDVISGGQLPPADYENHALYTSFGKDGKLKESALFAEEQGYSTTNDSNKDIQILKGEVKKLSQGGKNFSNTEKYIERGVSLFGKPDINRTVPKPVNTFVTPVTNSSVPKAFSFKPAITVAPIDVIKNSPEKIFDANKSQFSFSKPQDTVSTDIISCREAQSATNVSTEKRLFESKADTKNVFGRLGSKNELFPSSNNIFAIKNTDHNIFKKPEKPDNIFRHSNLKPAGETPSSIFGKGGNNQQGEDITNKNIFGAKSNFSVNKDNLFAKPDNNIEFDNVKGGNIFAKQTMQEIQQPSSIFKSVTKIENNPFMKPATSEPGSILALNGKDGNSKLSPGSLFKNASTMLPTNEPNNQNYNIFQSKNKAQSVADNILNSVSTVNNDRVYDFDQNEEDNKQEELRCLNEERKREQERKLQQKIKEEEERKLKKLQLLEEERRLEEARRKEEEFKQLEEKRKREEARKQEELKKKLEEEIEAEIKRKEEEAKRFRKVVEKNSNEFINDLIQEVTTEEVGEITKNEKEKLEQTVKYAGLVTEEILTELCDEICNSEVKAEKLWSDKTMRKWFNVWKKHYLRNYKRRCLLDDTPLWLCEKTPVDEATQLRRSIENATLKNMNAVHRGYKFVGELKLIPPPEPYNIMELIRSPLLKRMKQISYPYDKCFFWKVTLVSPGHMKWLHRKIEIEKWLHHAFNDKEKHESQSLIQVNKVSWNHLMDFAISVSLTCTDRQNSCQEAIEGTNAILFYASENEGNLFKRIEDILKEKYPYQLVPIAVIMGISKDLSLYNNVHNLLTNYVRNNVISAFHIFTIESDNVSQALNSSTKSALKWLAKKCPQNPPLEIDLLKSVCQRYLGNEIWCKLKVDRDNRMVNILKDLTKLIKCYNIAVEKLTDIITNENHFNYPSFPLEFKKYLDTTSLYPKPYEFIPSNVKNSENTEAIRDFMKRLLLPIPSNTFCPSSVVNMQQQIREYCYQLGWFENLDEVVCKVITVLPNQLVDVSSTCENFMKFFSHYDLIDILNVIVYEKINRLGNFDNRFAIYEKTILNEYCNANWLYEINIMNEIKHKALEYEDDVDSFIEAKRRKIAMDSLEYLMLEDKDRTLAEEKIKSTDESICQYNDCTEAVRQLEMQLEEGKKKSIEFENFLKAALSNF
ncbi:protein xmas-2 [Manduca sexta]|uniref:Protein xmas-2 n=1 Tax=Manduca sexta TaxID=7130 RepID=A0A922CP93_MANSE|nr:protein xmas-2 [Manduca sexta]KAG6452778.1 hypothetical protein O3G_MSEX007812 [Manduca sexta]